MMYLGSAALSPSLRRSFFTTFRSSQPSPTCSGPHTRPKQQRLMVQHSVLFAHQFHRLPAGFTLRRTRSMFSPPTA